MIQDPTIVITEKPSGPLNATQGKGHTLGYQYTDENGKKHTSGIEVTWNQDKDAILTVDQQGQLTPIKPGTRPLP